MVLVIGWAPGGGDAGRLAEAAVVGVGHDGSPDDTGGRVRKTETPAVMTASTKETISMTRAPEAVLYTMPSRPKNTVSRMATPTLLGRWTTT
jgi:hypothetical protein